MAVSKSFLETIKKYLDDYAKSSPEFAEKYANEEKNIEGCCKFIVSEVHKSVKSTEAAVTDDEVYYLARHYYEESNEDLKISFVGAVGVTHSPKPSVELTEEEKAKAKADAEEEFKEREIQKLKTKEKEKKSKTIAKIKKQDEEIGQMSLFDL